MKLFLRLYKKELKFLAGIGFILFLIDLGLGIEGYLFEYEDTFSYLLTFFYDGQPFYYSIMLVYSFFMENRSNTGYQLVALPVMRSNIVISKFLAVLSICALIHFILGLIGILLIGSTSSVYKIHCLLDLVRLKGGHAYLSGVKATMQVVRWAFLCNVSKVLYYSSFALISQVASESVQKHKIPVWVGIFLLLIVFDTFVISNLEVVLMWYKWKETSYTYRMFVGLGIQTLFSMILIVPALVLYDKFKEV